MVWGNDIANFDRNLAIVIGIDVYKNSKDIHQLNTAVSDANAVADLLETKYPYQATDKNPKIIRLLNEKATLTGIRDLLHTRLPNELKPTDKDRLIVYFAGHGLPKNSDEGPKGYLVPQDAEIGQEKSFLPMQEVYDALVKLNCHHLLVVLDCCFAGTFRWATSRKLIAQLPTIHKEHYDRFIRYPAWQVITSAAYDQEALDFVKLNADRRGQVDNQPHSPFALALLEALQDGLPDAQGKQYHKADFTKDGVVTAHELIVYLNDRVSELSKARQVPGLYPLKQEYDKGEFVFVKPDFDPAQLRAAPTLNDDNNPYRGLKSFGERHAGFFFGRQKLVKELSDRLNKSPSQLTVVLGTSGSGKSSLVKAGLIPHLRQESLRPKATQCWYILNPLRPGKSPFMELARSVLPLVHSHLIFALAQVSFLDQKFQEILATNVEQKSKPSQEPSINTTIDLVKLAQRWKTASPEAKLLIIVDYFTQLQTIKHSKQEQLSSLYAEINKAIDSLIQFFQQDLNFLANAIVQWSLSQPNTKLLLVIDQFEELLTMTEDDQGSTEQNISSQPPEIQELQEWTKFLSLLEVVLRKSQQQLYVVVTLRSDFEPRFLNSPLKDFWQAARFPIRAMNSDELREAIEGPALKQALYFNPPELVSKLIDEVSQMPGALPLLSFTLSELYSSLYQRWMKEQDTDRALQEEDYQALGGVAGALTRRATAEYDILDKASQATMRRLMLRMVVIDGGGVARRRVPDSELIYSESAENDRIVQVRERLVATRLLVKGQEANQGYVEPAHDFLVRGWDKLQGWITAEQENLALQQRLTLAANDYEKKQGELWSKESKRLDWLDKVITDTNNNWLNALETKFVTESRKKQIDDLKESEKQRDEAIQGQIGALNSLSEARFLAKDQLGALMASVKASRQLMQASETIQNNLYDQTQLVLSKTIDRIQERNRIQGHSGMVWDVKFSRDGKTIASSSYDKTIKLWSIHGDLIRILEGHTSDVVSISFGANDQLLASSSLDKTVKLWNLADGTLIKTIEDNTHDVSCVAFSPDGQILLSAGYDVKLWDLNGVLLRTISGNSHAMLRVVWNVDGKIIAATCTDNTIKMWGVDGKHINTLKGHKAEVTGVSFSPDGNLIASASADKTIKIWNLKGKAIKTLTGHSNKVWSVVFSPDSQLIASGSWDNTIKIWKYDGTLIQTFEGHSNRVWSVAFSADSQMIISGSADSTIRLWMVNNSLSKTLIGHNDWVWNASFSADNQLIASASSDRTVKLWNFDGSLSRTLIGHGHIVDGVKISSTAKIIASTSSDRTIKIWNFDGKELKTLTGHKERVRNVSFSPNGQILASTSHDHTIKIWNLTDGKLIRTLEGHKAEVIGISFSPNGEILASTSYDRTVKLWNPTNGELLSTLEGHDNAVIDISFSPDSTLIASASDDKTVKLWKYDGTFIQTLYGHSDWVFSVCFSFDSQIFASSSADRTIKIWSREGLLLKTLYGHDDWVLGVCFSSDSYILASASADKTVKIWNLDRRQWSESLEELLKRSDEWLDGYLKTSEAIK
jgi:WD40 repeat protein/energy-coupling factor transporter ATP-binding protein EcfA2